MKTGRQIFASLSVIIPSQRDKFLTTHRLEDFAARHKSLKAVYSSSPRLDWQTTCTTHYGQLSVDCSPKQNQSLVHDDRNGDIRGEV